MEALHWTRMLLRQSSFILSWFSRCLHRGFLFAVCSLWLALEDPYSAFADVLVVTPFQTISQSQTCVLLYPTPGPLTPQVNMVSPVLDCLLGGLR